MKIHDCDQGSAEWHALRCGIPTASEFKTILTPKTLEPSKQAYGYMCRLLGEWATGHTQETIETEYMSIGRELEDRAVKAYCFQRECEVEKIGFVTSDCGRFGCSPDRFVVGGNRGIEIKTHPQAIGVHVKAMLDRAMPDENKSQVQGCLWICEKEEWDLVSYTEELPTVIVRVNRDEKYIKALAETMEKFSARMEELRMKMVQEYGPFERKLVSIHDVHKFEAVGGEFPDTCKRCACFRNSADHDDAYDGMGVSDEDIDVLIQNGAIVPRGKS